MTKHTTQYGVWSGHKWVAGPLSLNAVKQWWFTHPEASGYMIAAMDNGDHRPLTIEEAAQFADCRFLPTGEGREQDPKASRTSPDTDAVTNVARQIQARSRAQCGALSRRQRVHKLEGMQELVTLLSAAGVDVPAVVHGAIQAELKRL